MSLPNRACLYKDGKIIGSVFVNIGWIVDAPGLIRTCFEAYNDCLEHEKRESGSTENKYPPSAFLMDNWKSFDHIRMYGFHIPRQLMNDLFLKNITHEEAKAKLHSGEYTLSTEKYAETSKDLEPFRILMQEKYGDKINGRLL